MKPGIYPGMSRADYDKIPAVNYSTLKHIGQSPAHYMQAVACPEAPTDDMALGTLIHTVCLAKDATMDRFAVAPKCDRRTKAGKEEYFAFLAGAANKTVVDIYELALATSIRNALESHPTVGPLLYDAEAQYEVAVVWRDHDTGILCKGLVDALGDQYFIDLKSAKDASPGGFGRDAARLGYHRQMAWYEDGLGQAGHAVRPMIVAVEKCPPFAVGVYTMGDEALALAMETCRKWLGDYHQCDYAKAWPSYSPEIQELKLPAWATQTEVPDDEPVEGW